jgi:hypothetical protein
MSLPSKDLLLLAEQFLSHLNREESSLREVRTSFGELHIALMSGSLTDLDNARSHQAEVAEKCLSLQQARENICCQLGEQLHLPPGSLTLSEIASHLPDPYGDRVRSVRDRLQVLAMEVDTINRRNTSLIGYCRTYMQRILTALTVGGTPILRYGPTGMQVGTSTDPLLIARG